MEGKVALKCTYSTAPLLWHCALSTTVVTVHRSTGARPFNEIACAFNPLTLAPRLQPDDPSPKPNPPRWTIRASHVAANARSLVRLARRAAAHGCHCIATTAKPPRRRLLGWEPTSRPHGLRHRKLTGSGSLPARRPPQQKLRRQNHVAASLSRSPLLHRVILPLIQSSSSPPLASSRSVTTYICTHTPAP